MAIRRERTRVRFSITNDIYNIFKDRPELSRDYVRENSKNIVKQLAEILEHGREMFEDRIRLTILNNIDWYENVSSFLENFSANICV